MLALKYVGDRDNTRGQFVPSKTSKMYPTARALPPTCWQADVDALARPETPTAGIRVEAFRRVDTVAAGCAAPGGPSAHRQTPLKSEAPM